MWEKIGSAVGADFAATGVRIQTSACLGHNSSLPTRIYCILKQDTLLNHVIQIGAYIISCVIFTKFKFYNLKKLVLNFEFRSGR